MFVFFFLHIFNNLIQEPFLESIILTKLTHLSFCFEET